MTEVPFIGSEDLYTIWPSSKKLTEAKLTHSVIGSKELQEDGDVKVYAVRVLYITRQDSEDSNMTSVLRHAYRELLL